MILRALIVAPAALVLLTAPGLAPREGKVPEGKGPEDVAVADDPAGSAAKEKARGRVLAGKFDLDKRREARGLARGHVKRLLAEKGNPEDDVEEVRSFAEGDHVFVHVRHTHAGVPVFGSEAIVEMETDGALVTLVDEVKPEVGRGRKSNKPGVIAATAVETAIAAAGFGKDKLTEKPETSLWFYRDGKGDDRLAWRIALRREDGTPDVAFPVYFIDAETGKQILFQYDNLQTAGVTVSGASNYHGTVNLPGYQSGSTYYLEDVSRKIGTFNYNNTTSSVSRVTDPDGVFNATNQKSAVDAHHAAKIAFDYYKDVHGRVGIDGSGGPAFYTAIDGATGLISSRVHYSTNYNNAFWNGTSMTYGDGDGTTFSSLTTLDIAGHELTHGVIERTAGLVYSGESGALNESIADVFGAMIERHARGELANTWKIGEEAFTPANGTGDALRHLDNPHAAANSGFTADDDPDHYSERYTGTADNGGVHINSGIANKAFYLAAKGGTHHKGGSMTGIGADAAAKIWYRALTTRMTSSTNFAGARAATLDAAAALYGSGSAQYKAVCDAWALVGVGTSCSVVVEPPPGTKDLLVNGGLETSLFPWVKSGTGAFHVAVGNYPQAGTGYAYLGSLNSVTGQVYQQIALPAGAAKTLTFHLNVNSAETTTTTQYDRLFVEVRNTAGTLLQTLGTYSNLNKGTAGSYSAKSFSLAAYAGQTIRIQFRATTDASQVTTFRVDSVSVK